MVGQPDRELSAGQSSVGEQQAILADAERELAALTGLVTGPVTVGTFPTAIQHLVAPAAALVAATNPNIEVRIRQLEREPGLAALQAGGLDLLIVETDSADEPAPIPGLHAIHLLDDPYQIVLPTRWTPLVGVEALLTQPWIDGPPGSATHRALNRIATHHDTVLNRSHECLEFPAALAIVASGLAVTVIPALALPTHEHAAVEVITAPHTGARRIDLVHRRGRQEPGPAANLVAQAITSQTLKGASARSELSSGAMRTRTADA